MRFLKKKIALVEANKAKLQQQHPSNIENSQQESNNSSLFVNQKATKQCSRVRTEQPSQDVKSTKNISKNFDKAICKFALSSIALPYLQPIVEREEIELKNFVHFINRVKEKIDGLFSFRSVMLIGNEDSHEIKAAKRVFKSIGEIFTRGGIITYTKPFFFFLELLRPFAN